MTEFLEQASESAERLRGCSVLVVEDNGLLSCVLEETLREAGCEVIGPFAQLSDALNAVSNSHIDVALLDINIKGELVSPLADRLAERRVPFVVTSAYRTCELPRTLQTAPQLRKPYTCPDVLEHLAAVLPS